MSSPTFFPEGSSPRFNDTAWRIAQKILGATLDGGGGGGGGTGTAQMQTGAAPSTPSDTALPALFYPTGGGAIQQWDIASQTWV
jgi:hypothetical protein